jgi:hypothetical protein
LYKSRCSDEKHLSLSLLKKQYDYRKYKKAMKDTEALLKAYPNLAGLYLSHHHHHYTNVSAHSSHRMTD